jgi:SAM-dependent methyltransferase
VDGTERPRRESPAKKVEQTLFESFEKTIQAEERILEIGAGTGRYTLPMARRAGEVLAVDVSPRSLEILRQKAREEKVENIEAVLADITQFPVPGTFDVICSFSAFEYIQSLQPTVQELVSHLKPGGRLYFITSHRSLFRFFSQIGNAMSQGLWLHARTRSQITDMLHVLGMENVSVSTHGMKSPINRGLLLEASARKK